MSSHQCSAFDPELESVQEFLKRFQVQNSDLLHKFRNDDAKKASLLIKALPVSIISDLQRRLAPVLLTDASYDDIHDNLLQQFSSQKSTIGSSVQFLTCKQQHRQSFEEYARQLNSLASPCNYPSTCLDRLLHDTFVAGISNSAILSSLIQVCDQLSFRETVERAKLLETYRQDVDSIRSTRLPATTQFTLRQTMTATVPHLLTAPTKYLLANLLLNRLICATVVVLLDCISVVIVLLKLIDAISAIRLDIWLKYVRKLNLDNSLSEKVFLHDVLLLSLTPASSAISLTASWHHHSLPDLLAAVTMATHLVITLPAPATLLIDRWLTASILLMITCILLLF